VDRSLLFAIPSENEAPAFSLAKRLRSFVAKGICDTEGIHDLGGFPI
jgi:hypothetical protein